MFEIFFLGDLRDGVSRYFQEQYQEERSWAAFRYMRVEGEQGTEYEGGCIEYPGAGTTHPLIDLHSLVGEYWKEDGFAMKEAIRKVAEGAERKLLLVDFSVMKEFQPAKGRLSMELINRERNQEKLSWRPYLPFLDLAIRFWVDLGTYEGKTVACRVTWKEMKDWGVTLEELCEVACQNEQKQGIRIHRVRELLEEEPGIGDNASGMEGVPLSLARSMRFCCYRQVFAKWSS